MARKINKPANPFILSGYWSSDYFCNRVMETKRLIDVVKNGRNITIISPRRMGKTGLIQHVFSEKEVGFKGFYVDIYSTLCLNDFVLKLGRAVIGRVDNVPTKILRKTFSYFRHLRPTLVFDGVTGLPQLDLRMVDDSKGVETLDEVFSYIRNNMSGCVIAIDEFQQIVNYPESNIEAILREYIQMTNNVVFVFLGSRKHIMENMFSAANRPFYQSTELMSLGCIEMEDYAEFAKRKFAEGGKVIDASVVEYLYYRIYGHTWYVQLLLNRLYGLRCKIYSIEDVDNVIMDILSENEAVYYGYRNLLTAKQWSVLEAIATEGMVSSPGAQSFIEKYDLGAASTVQSAFSVLVDKEMVLEEGGSYFVYDRFLGLWLKGLSKN